MRNATPRKMGRRTALLLGLLPQKKFLEMVIKQMNFQSKEIAKLSSLFPNDATLQHLLEAHAYFPEFFPKGFLEMNLQSYSLKAQKMNQIELYFPPSEQKGLEGEI